MSYFSKQLCFSSEALFILMFQWVETRKAEVAFNFVNYPLVLCVSSMLHTKLSIVNAIFTMLNGMA